MRTFFLIFTFSISFSLIRSQEQRLSRNLQTYPGPCANQNLEFIEVNSIKQLSSEDDVRFDLSGIVNYHGKILAIADKEWNKYIYELTNISKTFNYVPFGELCPDFDTDMEGIDYANNRFYLIEEYKSDVYEVYIGNCKMRKLEIPWEKYNIDRSNWGNAGFEGIAIDAANQILYLAKEREPRRIFAVNLKTMEIAEPFQKQLVEGGGHDIADMKYENGYLYVLERGLGQVTRINIETREKVSVSYQYFDYKDSKRLFVNENPQFGMAEALLLRNSEIWIGIDNNGNQVSEYGKSVGLQKGNKTAIFVFKRPLGF